MRKLSSSQIATIATSLGMATVGAYRIGAAVSELGVNAASLGIPIATAATVASLVSTVAHAQAGQEMLEEIVVTASRQSTVIVVDTSGGTAANSSQVGSMHGNAAPTPAKVQHAKDCAAAYGGQGTVPGTPANKAGPNSPTYQTVFMNAYGFGASASSGLATLYVSTSSTLPTGRFYAVGQTFSPHPSTSTPGISSVFLSNSYNSTTAQLVNTIAHEWSHQWNALDKGAVPLDPNYDAQKIGDAVAAAFVKDKGAKCGGP